MRLCNASHTHACSSASSPVHASPSPQTSNDGQQLGNSHPPLHTKTAALPPLCLPAVLQPVPGGQSLGWEGCTGTGPLVKSGTGPVSFAGAGGASDLVAVRALCQGVQCWWVESCILPECLLSAYCLVPMDCHGNNSVYNLAYLSLCANVA